jgi:hypothetical protein
LQPERGAQRSYDVYEMDTAAALPFVLEMRREQSGRKLALGGDGAAVEGREITSVLHDDQLRIRQWSER